MGIIYKLTSPSNKSYIGQTIQELNERLNQHKSVAKNNCRLLHNAIMKYGFEQFRVEILKECEPEELNDYEKHFIGLHDTLSPNGYNLTSGGDSHYYVSTETKQLVSKALKSREGLEHLPLYMGTVRKNKVIIGYKIKGHPNHKKQIKFVCTENPNSAYEKCKAFYETLDTSYNVLSETSLGRRRDPERATLPKHMYELKDGDRLIGYFIQGHPKHPKRKKFKGARNLEEAYNKAQNFLAQLMNNV